MRQRRASSFSSRKVSGLLAAALAVVTFAVFARAARFDFVAYDDPGYLIDCAQIRLGLSLKGIWWAFTGVHLANWHPLTTLSYLAEYQFFGLNPHPYHVTNVVLHVLATLSLFAALLRLTGRPYRSAFVAALFALHPLHVESVAWVSERKDVLCATFFFLTLWSYARYASHPRSGTYVATLVLFALALMSKPVAVTLPFVLLLLDAWPLRRMRFERGSSAHDGRRTASPPSRVRDHAKRDAAVTSAAAPQDADVPPAAPAPVTLPRLLLEKLPFFALSALSCVVTFLAQRSGGAVAPLSTIPLDVRLANAVMAYGAYLGKTIWPAGLSIFYPLSGSLSGWPAVAILLLTITAAAIALAAAGRGYVLVGWLWFLGIMVPVIGIVQVGDQAYADRYTYLPLVGLFVAAVWGAAEWAAANGHHRRRQLITAAVGIVIVLALGVRNWIEVGYWRDTPTLATRALEVNPHNHKAHLLLAVAAFERDDLAECVNQCLRAAELNPTGAEIQNRLALAYAKQHDDARAGQAWERSLEILDEQLDTDSRGRDPRYREALYNLALVRFRQGRLAEADALFRRRLEVTPQDAASHAALAAVLNASNRAAEAADEARTALKIEPDHIEAHYNLGLAELAAGRLDEAAAQLSIVLRHDPLDADANVQLAEVLRRQGNLSAAADHLRQALTRRDDDAALHLKLGALLQAQHQLQPAAEEYRRAIALNPQSAARNNLAWLLATAADPRLRDAKEALRLAESLRPQAAGNPAFLDTLAAAHAAAGDFGQAVPLANQAADAAHQTGQTSLERELRQRLALYEQRKPYIDVGE